MLTKHKIAERNVQVWNLEISGMMKIGLYDVSKLQMDPRNSRSNPKATNKYDKRLCINIHAFSCCKLLVDSRSLVPPGLTQKSSFVIPTCPDNNASPRLLDPRETIAENSNCRFPCVRYGIPEMFLMKLCCLCKTYLLIKLCHHYTRIAGWIRHLGTNTNRLQVDF